MAKPNWRPTFLSALRNTGNVSASAKAAGVDRTTAYKAKAASLQTKNATFAKGWDEAIEVATDLLEGEARRRAIAGVEEPVYYRGEVVGAVRKYSDTLLIFLLKAHRPEKFREHHSMEHSGPDGGPIPVEQEVDWTILLANPKARKALETLGMAMEEPDDSTG